MIDHIKTIRAKAEHRLAVPTHVFRGARIIFLIRTSHKGCIYYYGLIPTWIFTTGNCLSFTTQSPAEEK